MWSTFPKSGPPSYRSPLDRSRRASGRYLRFSGSGLVRLFGFELRMSVQIQCRECKETKPEGEFHIRGGKTRHKICASCKSDYNTQYYRKNKARHAKGRAESRKARRIDRIEAVQKAKDVPCMDCKNKYPSHVMDLDHRDPSDKLFTISEQKCRSMGMNRLLAEIAKCDVVCSNCHRMRTHRDVA